MIAVLQPKGEKSTSSEKNKNKKSYFFQVIFRCNFFPLLIAHRNYTKT